MKFWKYRKKPGKIEKEEDIAREQEISGDTVSQPGAHESGKGFARGLGSRVSRGALCFWLGFLIPAVVTLIGFAINGIWPFGDGTVLIIDSLHQYLPFYTDLHEKLVRHESLLYSFSGGLGYNFWATIAYYMASPVNFLLALIPKANVADAMDLLILLKIGLCGGTFSWYLHKRDPRRRFLPVVFGSMFALSNFIIGYYFNLMWLDSIAMLPLVLLGIERIVRGQKGGRLYGLSLFYALWCNYYIGFMLCIFACLYLLFCLAQTGYAGLRKLTVRCLRFGWYSLLAGGMASVLLVPAYLALTSSESVLNNQFPTSIRFYTDFVEMLLTHFAGREPINIADSQVGLNAYCGVIVLILTLLYLLDDKIRLSERLGRLFLAAFLMFSFSCNILNYIWHGFHVQNGLPNRFAFLYIAVLLTMAYDVMDHVRELAVWRILLAGLVPIGFATVAGLLQLEDLPQQVYLITLGLLAAYLLLLLAARFWTRRQTLLVGLTGGVMLAEAAGHGVYGILCNGDVTRSIYLADQRSFQELVAGRDGGAFFRSEIDSQRMRNVTMYAGGHALVMFNSTMPAAVTEFCDRLGIEARTNKNGYNGVTKLMNDVFGIRYVLSSRGKGDRLYQFEKVDADDNLTLYKNDNALSIGFLVDPAIKDWDILSGNPMEVQNQFVELATGEEPIYVLDRYIEMKDGESYGIHVPDEKQVYLYLENRVESLELNTPEYSKTYDTYTDHLYVINSLGEDTEADFTVTLRDEDDVETAAVYTCANSAYEAAVEALARNQLEDVTAEGNRLTGSIRADRDGMLLLTVPYDQNWRVLVDGKETEAVCIGSALMGIDLTAGEHEISMKYIPGGIGVGLALSLASAALFLLSCVLEKRRKEEEPVMELTFSRKAETLDAGIFAILNERREELLKEGRKIYNLSVGTPDFHTPQAVMEAVSRAALDPDNYKYSLKDLPELTDAVREFYRRRFGVELEAEEIMSIYGSQEGMAHFAWVLCDPGDLVLVPNPGYPIFKIGPMLCDAQVWEYPLLEENGFLPKLDEIPEEIAERARFMVVNYPGNPLCRTAPDSFYEELIAFAKKHSIVILHDNAYSDIVFNGRRGTSFLAFPGAKEVGVEFYSLSKSYNYTGARMSFVIGNRRIVEKFRALRSQFDYGIFLPVQYGAIAALQEPEEGVLAQCEEYARRNHALCQGLRDIGWEVPDSEGTMFVWAPLPKGYKDSERFCMELMERTGVICVPGSSFGSLGEGYVRFALVLPEEELREAVESIRESGILSV